ncbi:PQQ-dependent sugar dehydrogenase [Actinoplanes sp. NBRC 103695]|uniref:PQQ-dependent sugar dehydrogenase n=1 Tax=Actinoplanes sp. NBRC 103695 TaxID=3032202 RepID=UPI0024A22A63|nr:PQQ-dependent sugar dehydrogenase [Actinoplanes sp. NBRC 103695]GLY95302.1 glycosyl hydrolase [Actinoplanes sp. NBRC 103695]
MRAFPAFAAMLLAVTGGTLVASAAPAHADLPAADYQQVSLASGSAELGEPMSLAVLPDRSVLHTARNGTLRVTDAAGNTKVAGTLPVYTNDEEGLQGVGVDPGFATNRFIYLYYSPPLSTPAGAAPSNGTQADWDRFRGNLNLSRFTLNADNTLNAASQTVILQVPNDRGMCCHVGGDIDFDAAGNLYLTTGDDTNPFESNGYSPLDERTDRNPSYDAQRTSGNTNDLRGKLLRIKVNANGTYSIPSGNLFAPGTANTRPEIYAMGFRNPFRMSVDKPTGVVYLGDYGPDAGGGDASRGPGGQVEFNRITSAGNYGWPYCTGTNTSNEIYNEWNFASNSTGPKFNCAGGPANNSFRNTGQQTLPPARPAWIRYGFEGSPPEFGGGSESPMGGPVYRYDASNTSPVKFPQALDGKYFAGEYGRQWIKAITVNGDGTPGLIEGFPWTGTQVMDMAFGPDGALYVLDYGTGGNNAALWRVEYIGGGNRAPVAKAAADKTSGPAPLTIAFSSAGSSDPEGGALTYRWVFGDGTTSTAANPTKTFTATGTFTPTLTVTDPTGLTATASLVVTVGNTAPTVRFTTPGDGRLFSFGDSVPYSVTVTDPEDGAVDCAKVQVAYELGHDNHQHEIKRQAGCTGTMAVPVDGEHDAAANIFGYFVVSYTDNGGLTSTSRIMLQPRHRQAEHWTAQSGVQTATHAAAEGGVTVGFIENNDSISFFPYNISDATRFVGRVSSAGAGGTIEIRSGSATGTLHGTATVPVTGDWETFTTVSAPLSNVPAGMTTLYFVFKGGAGNLFDLDSFTLETGSAPTGGATLKALINNQYVSAANATTALIANRATAGATERFDVVDLGGGGIALRSRANSQFVCADNSGADPLIANRPAAGSWETFTLIRNADGSESLRATVNGKYVTAENAGAQPLVANRDTIGPWEKFDLVESS